MNFSTPGVFTVMRKLTSFTFAPALLLGAAAFLAPAAELPAEGGKAPDFTLQSQEGKSVSLKDFKGQWVVDPLAELAAKRLDKRLRMWSKGKSDVPFAAVAERGQFGHLRCRIRARRDRAPVEPWR